MISQTAEYALCAVVVLGSQPGRPMTTQDVARVSRVPGDYLSKVLQALGRAGLVGRTAACVAAMPRPYTR